MCPKDSAFSYRSERFSFEVPEPVAYIIRDLASSNGYTIAETIRILVRMGFEKLGDERGLDGTD